MKRRRLRATTRPPGRLSSHFTKAGAAKQGYRTEGEARSAAQLAWTLERVELNTYRCDHCHLWHIGRSFRDE